MEKPIPYQAAKEAELEEDAEGACDFETWLSVVLLLEVGREPMIFVPGLLEKRGQESSSQIHDTRWIQYWVGIRGVAGQGSL